MDSFDLSSLASTISYIVSVIIGGVLYKYVSLFLSNNTINKELEQSSTAWLVQNMTEQMKALTERISQLEKEREISHSRELQVTKELAMSQGEVKYLKEELLKIKNNQEKLTNELISYRQKYEAA